MRIPEQWLRATLPESLTASLSTEDLAHRLTMAGLEVEDIERRAPPFTGVVLGHILEAEKHPDADRLRVCKVLVAAGEEPLQIVCGAPNARAGIYVACATIGAELPGGFQIRQAKMRGVASQGMLCSAKELGLSEESEGIIEVDPTLAQAARLGVNLRDLLSLDEASLVLKLTPNRADCLSIEGVARELAALLGSRFAAPLPAKILTPLVERPSVQVHQDRAPLCGRFVSRIIRGVNAQAATPALIRARLEQAGQRPISALVDLSNYLMLEMGQPTHIFDLAKLHLRESHGLEVRWAQQGETLALLNGQTITLTADFGVVADAQGPVSLAGIMGGEGSSVGDDTTDVLLEAAFWWPDAIRGRSQKLKFSTDAAHRFERGVDADLAPLALDRLTALVLEVCGGQAGPADDHLIAKPVRETVRMRRSRCEKILGRSYSVAEIVQVFTGLGFETRHDTVTTPGGVDDVFHVQAPSYRFDIEREEDLIEEVARVIGFDAIADRPPVAELVMASPPEASRSALRLRQSLAESDFHEVVTYSFIDGPMAEWFTPARTPLRLLNPIAAHLSTMRPSLLPGLVAVLRDNLARREPRVRVFELGRVFWSDPSALDGPVSVAGVSQPQRIAALAYGPALPDQWAEPSRPVDFFDLKADLERLALPLVLTTRRPAHPLAGLHPGRSAELVLDGQVVGVMGELHPSLQQSLELPQAPVVFEIDLAGLLSLGLPQPVTLSKFPSVSRDLALVMAIEVAAGDVLAKIQAICAGLPQGQWVQRLSLFDDYRGKGLEANEKSLAFRFVLQDTEKTLEDSEVEGLMKAVTEQLVSAFSARLRS